MGWLQVDHIYPLAKGREDSEENLCLSCELCNQYKWTKTEELDPQSGVNVQLFNPRQQKWKEHFTWTEDGIRIIGLTACGLATTVALKLNNSLAITVRGNWVKAGWHPPAILILKKNLRKFCYLNRELVSKHDFLTDNYHPTLEIDRF